MASLSMLVVVLLAILVVLGFVGLVALLLWATGRLRTGAGDSASGHRGSPT
jgi:hypothetical protein